MNSHGPDKEPSADYLRRLVERLEAMRIAEYLELLEKPRRLVMTNFVAGVARGLGFAIGTTIVFAVVIEVLRRLILINIPVISDYLVDIIRLIEMRK
ncbi:DUF5665 domain-containing protein [Anaeroselena agilis]|uniref:DUF5665 domain-containing protein n=1 Tax=Anaeroselena agilis TaxID=3063788 RepID=A0ABU3P311_9FIRM|nr:DUF5665 domain-containing protein [Selenomonadales bacterium 4137-cl]